MYHVVLGHSQNLLGVTPVVNMGQAFSMFNTWWAIYIAIGLYSVDVFFFISAFLAAYLMISKFQGKRFFNVGMVYLHRIIRIVPSLLIFTALMMTFFELMGSGPIWSPVVNFIVLEPWRKNWWTNIIFISSWYSETECLGQLWYLANEMTYFLFVPFIVLVYINKRRAGIILVVFLNIASMILTYVFSTIRGHSITLLKDPASKWRREFYFFPYTRAGSYFIGVLFGIFYYEWMKSKKNPAFRNTIGAKLYDLVENSTAIAVGCFIIGSVIMICLILAPRLELYDMSERHISQFPSDIFNSLHRSLFVFALALFLAGPFVGKLGLIRGAFGGKLWGPWAKLTFTVYLIHINVISFFFYQTKGSNYITGPFIIFVGLACFFVSYLIAIPISLIIESPVLQLERLLLFPPQKKSVIQNEESCELILSKI